MTWRWTVTQAVVDLGYFRPFLQVNQNAPYGTVWYATDWHCRNITAAAKAQASADATASAVSTLENTVTQQGKSITSQGQSITGLQNGLTTANQNIAKKAEATALTALTNRVMSAEGKVTSQGNSITKLTNDLAATNASVAKKAEQTALNMLNGRVEKSENGLSAANSNITTLNAAIRAGNASAGDLIPNPTFESQYDRMGFTVVATSSSGVPAACPFAFAAKLAVRAHYPTINNIVATLGDVFEFSVLVACASGSADFNLYIGTSTASTTGVTGPYAHGVAGKASKNWQRVTWRWTVTQAVVDQGYFRPFLQINQYTPYSTVWYATDWHCRNITAAAKAQASADATASAVSTLQNTVVQQGKSITSQGSSITSLQNVLNTANQNIAKKADAAALTALTSRVTSAEGKVTSQGNSITRLTNDLAATNANISKKAEQTALSSLSGRVDKTESGLSTANGSITTLKAAIRAGNASSGDLIPNPVFDSQYDRMGFTVVPTTSSGVPAGCPFAFAAKLAVRGHHPAINNIVATLGDVFEFSALVACASGSADFNLYIGSAATPTASIAAPHYYGGTTKASKNWQRVTWRWTVTQAVVDLGYFRPFLQVNQNAPYGTVWYATDWHCRNITAAAKAQSTADATASAVSSLQNTVTQQGKSITSQGQSITGLQNSLNTANQTIAKKADATALTALTNRVTAAEGNVISQSNSMLSLESKVNTLRNQVSNPWFDGSLESYTDGQQIGGSPATVVSTQKYTGSKCLRLRRSVGETGNSNKLIGPWSNIRENAVYLFELWAMMPADQKPSTGCKRRLVYRCRMLPGRMHGGERLSLLKTR